VRAGPGQVDARNPADVYERSLSTMTEVLVRVAKDLKVRADAWPGRPGADPGAGPGATLVIVVDPTSSLEREMEEMAAALPTVIAEGPRGLRIGVLGAAAEWTAPTDSTAAAGALVVLRAAPFEGPKNLLDAVREAAEKLPTPATNPRAILLVSREGGDGEDDVEATRDVLLDRGVAFYSACREAGFERPWEFDFKPVEVPDLGLTQRFNPLPRRHPKGEIFYGCDVPFGLVPCQWETKDLPFAQAEFQWTPGASSRFPVPSGFGYYGLATLSWSTGGRCFVFDFRGRGGAGRGAGGRVELYDLGRLNLFAPDLRPRAEVLRDLERDRRAATILKIWDHLSDEEGPVVLDRPSLERGGSGFESRPMMPVRSQMAIDRVIETEQELQKANELAADRLKRVEKALGWWKEEAERDAAPAKDALARRTQADFDLLGFQLLKVRFHWGEVRAALARITPDAVDGHHRTRFAPFPLTQGVMTPPGGLAFGDPVREATFAQAAASGRHLADKYRGMPWALVVERGMFFSVTTRTEEIRPPTPPPREEREAMGESRPAPKVPPREPPPPPKPPPKGERPSSAGDGSTTPK
jgi:hypothetical protein